MTNTTHTHTCHSNNIARHQVKTSRKIFLQPNRSKKTSQFHNLARNAPGIFPHRLEPLTKNGGRITRDVYWQCQRHKSVLLNNDTAKKC